MTDEQKALLRLALRFCRDRVQIPARGALDYPDLARQIAALPDAQHIRECVAWVRDYERAELDTAPRPRR